MIELNCSYEESKKILELGYDFSKVCIDWSTEHTKYIKVGAKLVEPRLVEQLESQYNQELYPNNILWNCSLEFSEVESEIHDFLDPYAIDWITHYPTIPIIPKAALEACLPDYSFTDAANRKLSCRWYGHIPICNEAYALNNIHLHHKSGYEAFMWVHEYYPEELKKKFDEVMG